MGTQGTGRKRSTKKERATAEDDALNLIAREAEARLAAKRAARAEAREIRMKELERQQKELSSDDERMSMGSRGSVRLEDKDYIEKGSRAASALTAGTLTSLGGTSSRRGSGETAITVDPETSIREIKDVLAEMEEKYRKAMVSNAQLDNEKNNLMYQVDTLKDSLMELEELLSESRREFEEKVKEYEREKHAHNVLQFQFNEMKETLKQSEELLNKHGIVLGPDLNINGDVGEAEVDGPPPSGDSAPNTAPDSQTSPTEGNSMLGNTEEIQLRSSAEEEVEPDQHQEMLKEETRENHLFDTQCNVADVSTLKTSNEEQPLENQQTCLPTEEDSGGENVLSKDFNVDINCHLVTEAEDVITEMICSPELGAISASVEKSVQERETSQGTDLGEPSNSDLEEKDFKSGHGETQSEDSGDKCNEIHEQKESHLRIIESGAQQKVIENVIKETSAEFICAASDTKSQQEPENAIEEENDEAEEPSRAQPQGASAPGKKKKRKRRGKKKGVTHEDKNQHKDETDKENSITEMDVVLAKGDDGSKTAPDIDSSVTETFKKSKMDDFEITQERQETEDVINEVEVEPEESFHHEESLMEQRVDHGTNEHEKEQSLKTETVQQLELEASPEINSQMVTTEDLGIEHCKDDQDKEPLLQSDKVKEVESVDTNLNVSDFPDTSNPEGPNKEFTLCVDDSICVSGNGEDDHREAESAHHVENDVETVKEIKAEFTTNNSSETNSLQKTGTESHNAINSDSTANESSSNHFQMLSIKGLSYSEPLPVPEEATGTVEEPGVDVEGDDSSPSVISHDDHHSVFKQDSSGNLRKSEDSAAIDRSSREGERDTCDSATLTKHTELHTEECLLGPMAPDEHLDEVESPTVMSTDQTDKSNVEVCSETKKIDTTAVPSGLECSREVTETGFAVEEESAAAHDSGDENCNSNQDSETSLFLSAPQLPESSKDKSENDNSEVEEGQSFDFDDIDIEAAIASNDCATPEREDVEDGIEVALDEDNSDSLVLCQSNTEPREKTQDEPVDDESDGKCVVEDDSHVDALAGESGDLPQDSENTLAHAECEKEENVCEVNTRKDEPNIAAEVSIILDEGNALSLPEQQGASGPVEEGLDAIQHEMLLPKNGEQKTSNKESPESGKDGKKNSKKGKGKSKEECKMS